MSGFAEVLSPTYEPPMMKLGTLLSANARRVPDKVAVVCDGQRLTFEALETRANQLANALLAGGVKQVA